MRLFSIVRMLHMRYKYLHFTFCAAIEVLFYLGELAIG